MRSPAILFGFSIYYRTLTDGGTAADGRGSRTIAKFLYGQEWGASPLSARSLVIVEELSMAATRDLSAVVRLPREEGEKVVLVGDFELGAVGPVGLIATLVHHEAEGSFET
jgi:hypothetical protein